MENMVERHGSSSSATPEDVYTKTELQTSGQAEVHWDNITNKPETTSVDIIMIQVFS